MRTIEMTARRSTDTVTGSPSSESGGSMLGQAASTLGGAALQRKLARRLDQRSGGGGERKGGPPAVTILGVALTADAGATEFLALEKLVPKPALDLLHAAARGGGDVATLLQRYLPEGTGGPELLLLRDVAHRYAAWVLGGVANGGGGTGKSGGVDSRLHRYKKGFVYDGSGGNDYLDSLGGVPDVLKDLALAGDPAKQVEIFKFVTHTEGGTSAINTWDNQVLTIGAGFSAKTGKVGSIFLRMPPEFHARLAGQGITVTPDGALTVRREDGSIAEGDDALQIISQDEVRLSLLISLAESTEQMGKYTSRDWMLRAQFSQFLEPLAPYWPTLRGWDPGVVKVATKMNHWQSGIITWPRLIKWYGQGGADVMFSEVRATIVKHHGGKGDFSDEAVKARLEKRAGQAGITIRWVEVG